MCAVGKENVFYSLYVLFEELYSNLWDRSLFSFGSIVVACDFHSVSSSVACSWKFVSMLLR